MNDTNYYGGDTEYKGGKTDYQAGGATAYGGGGMTARYAENNNDEDDYESYLRKINET